MTILQTGAFGMKLTINGDNAHFDGAMTLKDLVFVLGIDPRKIAVERNFEIVPRSAYGETALSDGDRLEIVHFVGGG